MVFSVFSLLFAFPLLHRNLPFGPMFGHGQEMAISLYQPSTFSQPIQADDGGSYIKCPWKFTQPSLKHKRREAQPRAKTKQPVAVTNRSSFEMSRGPSPRLCQACQINLVSLGQSFPILSSSSSPTFSTSLFSSFPLCYLGFLLRRRVSIFIA